MANPWYPDRSHFRNHEEWDAHVQTLNIVYRQKAELEKTIENLKKVTAAVQQSNVGQSQTGGPITTSIGGFALQPGQPANGDTIRYSSAAGQFVFGV